MTIEDASLNLEAPNEGSDISNRHEATDEAMAIGINMSRLPMIIFYRTWQCGAASVLAYYMVSLTHEHR
jgi:hypothetical protein